MHEWTPPQIIALAGARPEINPALFDAIVRDGLEESEFIDIKDGEAYPPSPKGQGGRWVEEQEFTKDVAAFANAAGGWIIIGVSDEDNRASRLTPVTRSSSSAEESRLRQALATYAAPQPSVAFLHSEATNGGHFTIVSVPPSTRGPHSIRGLRNEDRRPHYFPIRDGSDTRWMNEPEIANHYRARQFTIDAQRVREQLLLTEGREFLQTSNETWTYLSVTPEFSADDRLDKRGLTEAQEWLYSFGVSTPFESTLLPQGRPMAKLRRATFTDSPSASTGATLGDVPAGIYVELFPNGQFFGACSLKMFDGPGLYYSHIRDDLILLSTCSLAWAQSRIGGFGSATVDAGIARPLTAVDMSLELVEARYGSSEQRMPDTRLTWATPRSRSVADLVDSSAIQGSMRVCYQLLADIGQFFGIAEPEGIRDDGSLVRSDWLDDLQRAEAWCRRHGIQMY